MMLPDDNNNNVKRFTIKQAVNLAAVSQQHTVIVQNRNTFYQKRRQFLHCG